MRTAAIVGIAMSAAGFAAAADTDRLDVHMTVLGVTLEKTTLLEAQTLLGPADLRHNGGDAAASASAECYVGADGTVLALISNSEMGGGTTITSFQLVEREVLLDYSQSVKYVVPSVMRPKCVILRALSRVTATAGGLNLGMNLDEVQRLLGRPLESSPGHVTFSSEAKVPLTPEQMKAFATESPALLKEGYMTRLRTIRADLVDGKVAALRVYQVTST
jgi:hypothetical protein